MSAQRLRGAATMLRESAEAAAPGPWQVSGSGSYICADHPQVASSARVIAKADDEWIDHRTNASYIALMAPPVAMALADWLDHEVEVIEHYEIAGWKFAEGRLLRSLALADAILGADS